MERTESLEQRLSRQMAEAAGKGMVVDLTLAMKEVNTERLRAALTSPTCQLARLTLLQIKDGVGSLEELLPCSSGGGGGGSEGLLCTLEELWIDEC